MRIFLRVTMTMLAASGVLLSAPDDTSSTPNAGSLIDAVKAGNLVVIQKTLQQRNSPNSEAESDGTTALERAVQEARPDIVGALIAAGADVNAKNQYGIAPLAVALTNGSAPIALQLLKAGASPAVQVPEMGTPLLAAAHIGDPDLIRALLKAGVNVDEKESKTGQTALMWAAAEGHEMAAKALLAGGADTKLRSTRNETALLFAVRKGDIGVVDDLLAAGADVNERADLAGGGRGNRNQGGNTMTVKVPGDSMLVLAIMNAHFRLADFLLTKKADPNETGAHWTPLHALSRVRNFEQMQYPAPVITPGDLDSLDLAKSLIAHGADVNARSVTPVAKRDGGDQNYVEFKGATPFFLASKSADVPYMQLLLAAGADPSLTTDEHTTPLQVAAGVGCVTGQWIEPESDVLAAVKLLVEDVKADVNAINDRNETPVHGAVCRNADSVIQYLVDKGARLNIKDGYGQTPLEQVEQGLTRAITINGPPIIVFHSPDHTIALVKQLTEEQQRAAPATQTTARR